MPGPLDVVVGDITLMDVDAIVNAANSSLMGGGGVDGAIHRAGGPAILDECRRIREERGPLPTGQAVITTGGRLPARHVIHTVGPIYAEHTPDEAARLLGDCYRNALRLAAEYECRTVAFPNISTGVYGYPKRLAAPVAIEAAREGLALHPRIDRVTFVCFDEENGRIYAELLGGGAA